MTSLEGSSSSSNNNRKEESNASSSSSELQELARKIRNSFNLPSLHQQQMVLDYHTYVFFKQTITIADPTILSTTLKEIFSKQLKDELFLTLFEIFCSQLIIYNDQYEKCKYSIIREQRHVYHNQQGSKSYNNQKMENLTRQLEQLEENRKLNYYVVNKGICNFLKSKDKFILNLEVQHSFLNYLNKLIIIEMNKVLKIDNDKDYNSNNDYNENQSNKKRKVNNELKNISMYKILEKFENNLICQLFFDIIKFMCKPQQENSLNLIKIPNEYNKNITNYLPNFKNIKEIYSITLWYLENTTIDYLYISFVFDNPFILVPYIIVNCLQEIHKIIFELNNNENIKKQSEFIKFIENTCNLLKRQLLVLHHLFDKFPELLKSIIFPFIKEYIFEINNWDDKNLLIYLFIIILSYDCEGFLSTIIPECLNYLNDINVIYRMREFIPFEFNEEEESIFSIILQKHLKQFKDFSYEFLILLKNLYPYEKEKINFILFTIINTLQQDYIKYYIKQENYNYCSDSNHQVSPPLLYKVDSLVFLNKLKFENFIHFITESNPEQQNELFDVWYYLLEMIGICGGETTAMNILIYLFKYYSFNNDKFKILFLKFYDCFTKNYSSFDEIFLEKTLWIITTDSKDSCNMVLNMCLWVNYLKDRNDSYYKGVVYYFIISKWQYFYPFLFKSNNDNNLTLSILEMFNTILKTKIKLNNENNSIVVSEMISNQMSQALLVFFFFLLKPTFTTKQQKRHQLRSKFKSINQITNIPSVLTEPDTDISSTLYYYYFIYITLNNNLDLLEQCRNILKEIISNLIMKYEKVANNLFDFYFDLLFSNHMESRLHATNVFTSNQVHEQMNYPLLCYKDTLSIINYFFIDEIFKPLSNDDIKLEDRNYILNYLFKDNQQLSSTSSSNNNQNINQSNKLLGNQLPSNNLVEQLNIPSSINSPNSNASNLLEDQLNIRTKGVVVINPHNVQFKLLNKNLPLQKESFMNDKQNEETVKLNKSHILSLISKCLFSKDSKRELVTLQLCKQLMKRLKLQYPTLSYQQLSDILPKKPMTDREIIIDKLFHKFPIMYSLLDFISLAYPKKFLEIDSMESTLKSLFVNVIGEWNLRVQSNNKGFGTSESDKHLIMKTIQIINILTRADLIIEPLNLVTEIIPHVKSAKEVVDMLVDVFRSIQKVRELAVTSSASTTTTTTGITSATTVNTQEITIVSGLSTPPTQTPQIDIESYLGSTKDTLRKYIEIFAPIYSRFTNATANSLTKQ
ncbi:hypothetical protein ABK040_010380 [Willaertia magna]